MKPTAEGHAILPMESAGLSQGTIFWERFMFGLLAIAASIPVIIVLFIFGVFLKHSWQFFQVVSWWSFLTDTQWSPLFSEQHCGILVLASATIMIVAIALTLAIPLGLLTAIYLSEYASPHIRRFLKPIIEALSGVPTIVYGYVALLLLTPVLQTVIPGLGSFNALSAGLITGILITPTISALSEDAIRSVPRSMHEAGYAMGMTRREIILSVLLPVALPGIVAAITLAASQALGETMIASIAAGQSPRLTLNPLVPVSSITAFIIQVSLGDLPPDSFIFDTVFTVGFVLFLMTLALNGFGHWLVRRYRQQMLAMTIPTAETTDALSSDGEASLNQGAIASLPPPNFAVGLARRYQTNHLFHALSLLAALIAMLVFVILVWAVIQGGAPNLSWDFLTQLSSRDPENAGIFAAFMGTCLLLLLTSVLAFPIGIGAAVFLEEYLPDNRLNHWLEIQLANLAAVPSILYGLLGLILFAEWMEAVTGGRSLLSAALVMVMVVLPVIVIATRSALRAVPENLRQAGYAVGMGRWQMIRHLILPAARPGLITGMLLALSRVAGETAALIAIGAAAFVSFAPDFSWVSLQSGFTTLTTQSFYWISRPQEEFHHLAAATILVLGCIVLVMNSLALMLRDFLRQPSA